MKIILQQKEHINLVIFTWCTSFFQCLKLKKKPDAKAAVEKEWETLEKIPAWQLTKVTNKKEVIDGMKEKSSFRVINGSLSSQKFSVGAEMSKVQRQSCVQRWHCERWFRIIRSTSTRIISIKKDSSKSSGRYIQTSRMFRSNRWFVCSVHLTRIISVKKDSRKDQGHKKQDYRDVQDKHQTQQR